MAPTNWRDIYRHVFPANLIHQPLSNLHITPFTSQFTDYTSKPYSLLTHLIKLNNLSFPISLHHKLFDEIPQRKLTIETMVVPLGPGKFYGSSLPRPRIYTDVKFNDERIDPPVSVTDPLLSWANEAHWSMGGLSLNRLRLQGKIEGNVAKLRKEKEMILKKKPQNSTPIFKSKGKSSTLLGKACRRVLDSPPAAPVSRKLKLRSRLIGGDDDDDDDEEKMVSLKEIQKSVENKKRRRLVRKLGDDFEKVADENGKKMGSKRSPLKDVSNGEGDQESVASRAKARTKRTMVLMAEEEDEVEDEAGLDGSERNQENSAGVDKVASKKSGKKGSVSPGGTRSSPRLKQK